MNVASATALALVADRWPIENPRSFFYVIAIALTTWFAGAVPGSIAVILSVLAVDYFFIAPIHVLDLGSKTIPWFVSFAITCVFAYGVSLQRKKAEITLLRARNELEINVRKRTRELSAANEKLIREIGEREQMQNALSEAQREVVRLNRVLTVGELTASITHEIRQPLTSIVAHGDAAIAWLQQTPPRIEKVEQSINDMLAAALRTTEVLQHIQSLIKRTPSQFDTVAISDVFERALQLAKPILKHRHIRAQYECDTDFPALTGDRVQLEQVVLNLLTNAADALVDVKDRLPHIKIQLRNADGKGIVALVEDNGCGMSGDEMNQAFAPFFSTKTEGIGMGLSLCRSIITRHSGNISVTSRKGQGTCFRIFLPAQQRQNNGWKNDHGSGNHLHH